MTMSFLVQVVSFCRLNFYFPSIKFSFLCLVFSHATEVMETEDWKRLVVSHSNIVADAFRALASLKASPPIWGPPKKKQKPG